MEQQGHWIVLGAELFGLAVEQPRLLYGVFAPIRSGAPVALGLARRKSGCSSDEYQYNLLFSHGTAWPGSQKRFVSASTFAAGGHRSRAGSNPQGRRNH